jgi:hypothetical protein
MERRQFTREFKLEAVRLIKERGVSYAQASEDLGVHPTQLRNWVPNSLAWASCGSFNEAAAVTRRKCSSSIVMARPAGCFNEAAIGPRKTPAGLGHMVGGALRNRMANEGSAALTRLS